MMMIVHIFLLNIVINKRQQCHCHDRPIILWRPCVFGILLTGSPPPPWAHFQHILDLLTNNHSHRKPNDKAVISDWKGWLWRWWIFETSQKSVNMLSILQGQKGVLEMSIRGHQDVFEVKQNTNFLQSNFIFSDLAAHNWTVWPVCAQRQESEETWCRETFKVGASGCRSKEYLLIFLCSSFEKKKLEINRKFPN